MDCSSSKLLFSFVVVCSFLSVIASREITIPKALGEEGNTKCWDSLFELQSCTGEIVLFFINGKTFLGPGCCDAIKTIQHHCWPSMLGSVGISADEGDDLLGYCDTSKKAP